MMLKYPGISCKKLDIILRMTWIDIDYLMNSPIENIYEPMTFEKYLMVSKDKEMSNSLEVMLCLIKDYWGYSFVFKLCLECQVMFNKRLLRI